MLQITSSRLINGFIRRLIILPSLSEFNCATCLLKSLSFSTWNSLVLGQCWVQCLLLIRTDGSFVVIQSTILRSPINHSLLKHSVSTSHLGSAVLGALDICSLSGGEWGLRTIQTHLKSRTSSLINRVQIIWVHLLGFLVLIVNIHGLLSYLHLILTGVLQVTLVILIFEGILLKVLRLKQLLLRRADPAVLISALGGSLLSVRSSDVKTVIIRFFGLTLLCDHGLGVIAKWRPDSHPTVGAC